MIEIARERWKLLHPKDETASSYTQFAIDPLPVSVVLKEGSTTILQTMGVCSIPKPASKLAHLGTLADPVDGRISLLEH